MNYQQYVKACDAFGFTGKRRYHVARMAIMPAVFRGNPHTLSNLRLMPVFAAHPELLRVPLRVLKKWGARAAKETLPRAERR